MTPSSLDQIQARHPDGWMTATHSPTPGFLDVRVHAKDEFRLIATYRIPHPRNVVACAITSFHDVATRLLKSMDRDASMTAIADLVGERRQNYAAAVGGSRGGSLDRVERWLCAWEAAGMPPLRLRVGPGHAYVFPVQQVSVTVCVPHTVPSHMAGVVRRIEERLVENEAELGGVVQFGSDIDSRGWIISYRVSSESAERARHVVQTLCAMEGARVVDVAVA